MEIDMDPTLLWNAILTIATGAFLWWIRGVGVQLQELREKVAKSREDAALTYATKTEVTKDIEQMLLRFDRLEDKIDNVLSRIPIGK